MRKISIFTVVFLFVFASATFVMARQQCKGAGKGQGKGMYSSAVSNLNLTAEQSEKIMTLRKAHMEKMTPLRIQLYTKRMELKLLWVQTDPDPVKIKALQKEILGLRGQMQSKSADHRLAFRSILTPEQLTKLLAQGLGRGHDGPRWGKKGGGPGSQGKGMSKSKG